MERKYGFIRSCREDELEAGKGRLGSEDGGRNSVEARAKPETGSVTRLDVWRCSMSMGE